MTNHEALIIVDVQKDYFPGGELPTWRPVETAEAIAQLVSKFRKEDKEVVHVYHVVPKGTVDYGFLNEGTEGINLHPIVQPLASEKVVKKHHVSSFVDTDLAEYLRSKGITKLIIVGMMIHNCVNATVYSAVDEGFECIVVDEAVNTMDHPFDGKMIKAEDMKTAFLAGIQFSFANVFKLNDVLNNNYTYVKNIWKNTRDDLVAKLNQ